MDTAEKLEQSEISKNKGTDHFKAAKFHLAKKYYTKIVDILKNEDSLKGDEADKKNALLLAAHLNLAMCHLKQSNDVDAIQSCDEALKVDPKNEKGLFRRGTANLNLQNFDEALHDFKAVLEVDPENKAAKNQIVITNHKIKQIRDREKQTYAGMFQKFAARDAKKEQSQPTTETKESQEKQSETTTSEESSDSVVNGQPSPVEASA
jgi:tetratricopeptide (TPR) repeat protein